MELSKQEVDAVVDEVLGVLPASPPVGVFDWMALISLLMPLIKAILEKWMAKQGVKAFDWMALLQLLLPIIQAILEKWLSKNGPTPEPLPPVV